MEEITTDLLAKHDELEVLADELKELTTETKEVVVAETKDVPVAETKDVPVAETKEVVVADKKEEGKIDKRCLSCKKDLTGVSAKAHYFEHHKMYYAFIYEKDQIMASLQDETFLSLAGTYAKCGKCKEENACEHCKAFFEAKQQTYL